MKDKKKKEAKNKSLPKSGEFENNNGLLGGGIVAILGSILAVFGLRRKQQ